MRPTISSGQSIGSESPQPRIQPIKAEDLKIGMYVDLNCSWFKHPFATKSFKITTEKELTTIRALGLTSILIDPSLSDREPPMKAKPEPTPSATCAAHPSLPAPTASWTASRSVNEYQNNLQQTGALFRKSVERCNRALKSITKGSREGLAEAKAMVNDLTELLSNDAASSAITAFIASQDLEDNSTLHAMNVTALAMMVGRQFALSPDQTKLLGIAGLLHDIGERELPPRLLMKRYAMNKAEQVLYQQHVPLSIDLLREFPGFPTEAMDVILQHHERVDGSGYPFRLQGDTLSLLARILMVVDEYDGLINASDTQHSLLPAEALAKLYSTGKPQFSPEVIVALVKTLSVYPPGSVVELDDKSLGLVINMNLECRMRPLVIVYDPTVAQDNPTILDLSQELNRSIARSVPKTELPKAVLDSLSLRRWTGYFVRSSADTIRNQRTA